MKFVRSFYIFFRWIYFYFKCQGSEIWIESFRYNSEKMKIQKER